MESSKSFGSTYSPMHTHAHPSEQEVSGEEHGLVLQHQGPSPAPELGAGMGCCRALALLPPPSHGSLSLKIPIPLVDVWDPRDSQSLRALSYAELGGCLSPGT